MLHVVGDGAGAEMTSRASDDVRVHGYVPDAGPLFRGSRVLVAPMRYGAGAKGKVGEALAHGLPVVTTGIGAEGMGFTAGRELLVADSPQDFAAAVVRVYLERRALAKPLRPRLRLRRNTPLPARRRPDH